MIRKLPPVLLILALAVWDRGMAAELPNLLVPLLEQKVQIALGLTEPISQCVTRNDTNHPVFHGWTSPDSVDT